jgi:hypothetical protein
MPTLLVDQFVDPDDRRPEDIEKYDVLADPKSD